MYPMLLAQVWMHSIEFSIQTFFLQFFWISNTNTHQKFNSIVHILGLKITKSTLLNQTLWGFFDNTKSALNYNIVFDLGFSKNSMKKWFNNQ
jgi:hypothetical protein